MSDETWDIHRFAAEYRAKAALLDEAVKALEGSQQVFKALSPMIHWFAHFAETGHAPEIKEHGLPAELLAAYHAEVGESDAILTRLRDVPVHDSKGEAR